MGKRPWIPQAMIAISVAAFIENTALDFDREEDDLDTFSVIYLDVNGRAAQLKHYDRQPGDGIMISLERGLPHAQAAKTIDKILRHYHLAKTDVTWWAKQRGPA
ncbi:MAG: hypothetical protein EXR07_09600 [Acetobacteraceae bacterium]|nr:hypothetical protein [Acetobacteraceae bacterium]